MASIKVGDSLPEGSTFTYIPYTPDIDGFQVCGLPIQYDANKEWANKKVVLFSLPGAFTPSCSASHLPGYIANLDAIKAKGVDIVAVIAYNDAYVMSAWGKANHVTDENFLFLSDADAAFSKKIGWTIGDRDGRYALIIDHGKIVYAENEPHPQQVTVSGAEAILKAL